MRLSAAGRQGQRFGGGVAALALSACDPFMEVGQVAEPVTDESVADVIHTAGLLRHLEEVAAAWEAVPGPERGPDLQAMADRIMESAVAGEDVSGVLSDLKQAVVDKTSELENLKVDLTGDALVAHVNSHLATRAADSVRDQADSLKADLFTRIGALEKTDQDTTHRLVNALGLTQEYHDYHEAQQERMEWWKRVQEALNKQQAAYATAQQEGDDHAAPPPAAPIVTVNDCSANDSSVNDHNEGEPQQDSQPPGRLLGSSHLAHHQGAKHDAGTNGTQGQDQGEVSFSETATELDQQDPASAFPVAYEPAPYQIPTNPQR